MSAPRHLWSGDWQDESSAHGDELAAGRSRATEPEPQPPAAPSRPRRPTLRDRLRAFAGHIRAALARLRALPRGTRRQRRIAILAVAATLLLAGAAYAVTSAVGGSGGHASTVASGSRAWLGIEVTRSSLGGVMVANVFPGSPAQVAGMEAGDLITQINGHPIVNPSDVASALAHMHPGDHVQLQFEGSGTRYSARVPLGSPPAGYP